jgi:hypothetical protein
MALACTAFGFEGRLTVESTQGGQVTALLYTVGSNALRIEVTGSDRPNPVDVLDLKTGALTLLFPHNRSFVRLKPAAAENPSAPPPGFGAMPVPMPPGAAPPGAVPAVPPGAPAPPPGFPPMPAPGPGLPPGVGPSAQSAAGFGPGIVPAMPMMPMPGEMLELKATGEKTNLLGFACEKFELTQRGERMEIWATQGLLPFQNYLRSQPPRFGPRMIEEQWAGVLAAKRLFPLRASLRFENGTERFRFEVKSATPQKLKKEEAKLFGPPADYVEIQPLPF